MHQEWLMKAVQIVGSQKKLADLTGIPPEKISYLINQAKKISWEDAVRIEVATNGVVSRYHLIGYIKPALKHQAEQGIKSIDQMSISERACLGNSYHKELGPRQGTRSDLKLRKNFPEVHNADNVSGRTDDIVAAKMRFNNRQTYRQALQVVKRGSLELIQAMDSKFISINAAFKLLQLSQEDQIKVLNEGKTSVRETIRRLDRNKKIARCQAMHNFDSLNHSQSF